MGIMLTDVVTEYVPMRVAVFCLKYVQCVVDLSPHVLQESRKLDSTFVCLFP